VFFQDARSLVGDQIGLETELQQRAEIDVPATRPTSELFSVLEPGGWRDVWQIGLVAGIRSVTCWESYAFKRGAKFNDQCPSLSIPSVEEFL
jgi:hypothetical protein